MAFIKFFLNLAWLLDCSFNHNEVNVLLACFSLPQIVVCFCLSMISMQLLINVLQSCIWCHAVLCAILCYDMLCLLCVFFFVFFNFNVYYLKFTSCFSFDCILSSIFYVLSFSCFQFQYILYILILSVTYLVFSISLSLRTQPFHSCYSCFKSFFVTYSALQCTTSHCHHILLYLWY